MRRSGSGFHVSKGETHRTDGESQTVSVSVSIMMKDRVRYGQI